MNRIIKRFDDGSVIEYGKGAFDDWCVYLTRPSSVRRAPMDKDYFEQIIGYGEKYSPTKFYEDFVKVFDYVRLERAVTEDGHALIKRLATAYISDELEVEILLSILLLAMVAEERKKGTKLGAKIKRLGVHQILLDSPRMSSAKAANFSRGMSWKNIELECAKRGF